MNSKPNTKPIEKRKCKWDHSWPCLNKDFRNGIIVAFCDECGYEDKKYSEIQRIENKTQGPLERAYVKFEMDKYYHKGGLN